MTEEKFLKELTEWYREPIDGMRHLTQISFTPYQLLQFIEQLEKNNFIKPDVSGSLPHHSCKLLESVECQCPEGECYREKLRQ